LLLEYRPSRLFQSASINPPAKMNFHIPTKPEEWVEVNQLVLSHYQSSISPSTHITIWLVTVLGPIPGILYLISAVKKCQINGWWLVRVDEGGYLYPHNRVMLSTWVIALTIGMLFRQVFNHFVGTVA
jgi:hypothetical protein